MKVFFLLFCSLKVLFDFVIHVDNYNMQIISCILINMYLKKQTGWVTAVSYVVQLLYIMANKNNVDTPVILIIYITKLGSSPVMNAHHTAVNYWHYIWATLFILQVVSSCHRLRLMGNVCVVQSLPLDLIVKCCPTWGIRLLVI